jgi:hypothetical protein
MSRNDTLGVNSQPVRTRRSQLYAESEELGQAEVPEAESSVLHILSLKILSIILVVGERWVLGDFSLFDTSLLSFMFAWTFLEAHDNNPLGIRLLYALDPPGVIRWCRLLIQAHQR